MTGIFERYLTQWGLTPDGAPIATQSSRLLPVRKNDAAAMLKIAVQPEERYGNLLMSWWNGQGTARVIAHEGEALLMERAEGRQSLAHLARNGHDDEATRIICNAVARLHAHRNPTPPEHLVTLARWFRELALYASHKRD